MDHLRRVVRSMGAIAGRNEIEIVALSEPPVVRTALARADTP